MKTVLQFGLLALLCSAAHAQFYAPAVDFHDVAQRRFPVEAARVLAWQRKASDPQITEITYQVEPDQTGQIVWSIDWRKQGGSVRKATVRYPEAALRGGAEWYRDVWKQLTGEEWALAKTAPGDLGASFWQGAQSAGLTRLEGIAAATACTAAEPPSAATSARCAGALVQSALPIVCNEMSIDGALLARSAAWLCAAEQQSGQPAGLLWAPLLSLAGREHVARAQWGAGPPGTPPLGPLGKCWHFVITLPNAPVALAEIAQPENRLYAAPVFEAYRALEPTHGKNLIELGKKLYPGSRWDRLQDYAAELNFGPALPVGPMLPRLGLRDWVAALGSCTPATGDFAALPELAKQVHDFDGGKLPESPSAALAALLNSRLPEGEGPLIPVAAATGRDLLVFGWEIAGVQFACLQGTYAALSGNAPKTAAELEKNWTGAIAGWEALAARMQHPGFQPLDDYGRLEFVGWKYAALKLLARPPAGWPGGADAFLRRRWLGDTHRGLDYLVAHEGTPEQATTLLRRAMQEGGPRTLGALLVREHLVTPDVLDQAPGWPELPEVNKELRQAVPGNVQAIYYQLAELLDEEPDSWKKAQALERFHWATGIGYAPQIVFSEYVRANALQSADRFYDRWKGSMTVNQALKDIGPTFSGTVELTTALLKGDLPGARKLLDKSLERSAPNAVGRTDSEQMRAYIDLIPALNDPRHADHQQAVASFPKGPHYLVLQWMLLAKAKLPPEEAIRFLESSDDPERAILVAALQGDKPGFAALYEALTRNSDARSRYWKDKSTELYGPKGILFAWLHNLLFAVPVPKEQPDLRPPGAEPLLPMLRKIASEPLPGENPRKR